MPTYSEVASDAYCRVIWPPWLPFTLGFISIYNCLVLTIERWLAVVKPQVYRSYEMPSCHLSCNLCMAIGSCYQRVNDLPFQIRRSYERMPMGSSHCLTVGNLKFSWMMFTLQTLPMAIMVVLYSHVYHTLKKLPTLTFNRDNQLKRVTLISLAACSALIVGWLPGRITFLLTKYDVISVHGSIHLGCVTIAFLNSCVNPCLYGIYSHKIRQEYKMVFAKLIVCGKPRQRISVAPISNKSAEDTV